MKKLIKAIFIAPIILLSTNTAADGFYLDLGLAVSDGEPIREVVTPIEYYIDGVHVDTVYYDNSYEPFKDTIGTIELGYTIKNFTIYASHVSDIRNKKDHGLNLLGIKIRFGER